MEQKAVEGGVKRQQRGFTSEEILSFVGVSDNHIHHSMNVGILMVLI